jgi:CRP-like cAMP-binding protein
MDARDNLLLAALNDEERAEIVTRCRRTGLKIGQVLYEQDELVEDAYFFTSGGVSLLIPLEDGRALEPAIIGREGMLGFPIGLGDNRSRWRSVVQIPGETLVMRRSDLEAHLRQTGDLAALLAHYAGLLITFTAQSAACTQFHSLEQRTARWLLLMHDRAQADDLQITHEFLAYMLGVHRPSETLALDQLRAQGLISMSRGTVHIANREGLKAMTCECYARVERDYAELVQVSQDDDGTYQSGGESKAG